MLIVGVLSSVLNTGPVLRSRPGEIMAESDDLEMKADDDARKTGQQRVAGVTNAPAVPAG